jgi:ATP-binding cassette, subfamily B, bacterial
MNSHNPASSRRDAISWLYSFLVPHRYRILGLAGLSLFTTALVVVQPYMTKLIIDDGLLQKDFQALITFSSLLLLLGFATTLLSGFNRIQHTRLSGRVLFALREDVYAHLLKLPAQFYHRQRAGDMISRMDRDISEIQRFAVDTLFSSFSAIIGLLGATAMMLYLNWQLSLVLLLLVPLELYYLFVMRPKVEQRNIEVRESGANISSFFAEKIPATKFVQTAVAEEQELKNLGKLNNSFLGKLIGLQITEFWTSAVPSTLVSISRAAIFLIGGYWVIQGSFDLGSLIAFTTYVGMAIGPVQSLLGLYLSWQRLRVSLDRVRFLRQQPVATANQTTGKQPLPAIDRASISINNLSFAYDADRPVFDNINLHIPAGSKVGIVGESGIGKSTLIDLLQGHIHPSLGSIEINNVNLASVDIKSWRKKIAVAPQEPTVFHDTLANNIRYSQPHASDQEVEQAARAAGLEALISTLPNGLQTLLSERGSQISGGERQRIGIARALLQRPLILILDEPTSATDTQTEQHIISQVDALFPNTTRIIISHRSSILRNADLTYEISNRGAHQIQTPEVA